MKKSKLDLKRYALKDNFSIPNLISLFRLLLVPFIMWSYFVGKPYLAVVLIVISGISDGVDGYIARRFNQKTELGKVMDPLADKVTQLAVAAILCFVHPSIIPMLACLLAKELVTVFMGLRMMREGLPIIPAKWYGKASTIAFYVGVVAIMLFSPFLGNIGVAILSGIVSLLLLIATVGYWREFDRLTKEARAAAKSKE
ncbi:MAG: CDP-alcohol phosphatidyltransferase family protein [Bacillota bacterium]|nr:CDP-alcohol phosphatidyltransferase family protein [Bacillota bacterium]